MFFYHRTNGFVLAKNDFREADQVFNIFTSDYGKLEIVGRAIRKIKSKLRPAVDIFFLSELEFIQGKNLKTLTDARALEKFKGIRADFKKLKTAYKILETTDELIRYQEKDEGVFILILETFFRLEKASLNDNGLRLLYYYYFWNLITLLGYQADFYNCAQCQKKLFPENLYFSASCGGVICPDCLKNMEERKEAAAISAGSVKIMRFFTRKNWALVSRLKIENGYLNDIGKASGSYLAHLRGLAGRCN